MKYLNHWKVVAESWRKVDNSIEKLDIIQKMTQVAITNISQDTSFVSRLDYLSAPMQEGEDEDLP